MGFFRYLVVIFLVLNTALPGCMDKQAFPDWEVENEIFIAPGEYHVMANYTPIGNATINFQTLNLAGEPTMLINVYTLTETNFNDFVNCQSFAFIDELSWENSSSGDNTHYIERAGEEVYLVLDNYHCSADDSTQEVNVWYAFIFHSE